MIGGRKCDLRLCARLGAQRPGAESRAVAAGAIPLREPAARRGAENLNFHEGTLQGAMQTDNSCWRRKEPFTHKTARSPQRSGPTTQDYNSALAYELTSQFRSISSCCGVTHSIAMAPWLSCNPQSSRPEKDSIGICGRERGFGDFQTNGVPRLRGEKDEHQAKVFKAGTRLFCYMRSINSTCFAQIAWNFLDMFTNRNRMWQRVVESGLQ